MSDPKVAKRIPRLDAELRDLCKCLRSKGSTLSAVIRNADLVEPQGSDGAAQVGLIVFEFLQLIENAPIDQAEV